MGATADGSGSSGGATRWRLGAGRRLVLVVGLLVSVSLASQTSLLQPPGPRWLEIGAGLMAPAWAMAVIPIAGKLHSAAGRGRVLSGSDSLVVARLTQRRWAELSARGAQIGAVAIVAIAYAREWEWFGQGPGVGWFAGVIIATLAFLVLPSWWLRAEFHRVGVSYLDRGKLPVRLNGWLFDGSNGRPARWAHVMAFAVVTMIVAFMILGQFDALLRGMHPAGAPPVGISGLPAIDEFDLSAKPDIVIQRVAIWRDYTESVGGEFGSAYSVVATHAILDTLATIPAYLAAGVVLALVAWRRRLHFGQATELRRAFELVVLAGLLVLVTTAVLDVGKNLLTWLVMDRAWNDPGRLSNAPVRMLWGFALARTVGLGMLAAACLLLLALADTATRKLRGALVAIRWEILLLGALGMWVLMSPQTADVIRGWRVSHALVTVGLTVVFAMLLRWTAVQNLRLQHGHWKLAEAGQVPEPHRVRVPFSGSRLTWGTFAGASVLALALVQLALEAVGLPVGRGLAIPAGLVVILWLFGLPLPAAPFHRGDRPVPWVLRRRLPRMLGSAVFLIFGLAIIKAAATSVAYARNEDWWLLFTVIPPAIGLWRIATRSTDTMGWIEAVFGVGVGALLVVLLIGGDPELSPSTLAFAGVTFTYGALAFFNSYERASLVNRISSRFLGHRLARPVVGVAIVGILTAVVWFYTDPVSVAPRIGALGMTLMAMMAVAVLGAGAVRLSEQARPPRLLSAFGIRRTPVVTLLIVWLLLAPMVVDQRTNDIRIIESAGAAAAEPDFADVWERWAAANLDPAGSIGPGDDRRVVPLILVSSSGGGLRAAAWTGFVMDCVFEGAPEGEDPCLGEANRGDPLQRVALMSGVSGGSLGLGAYAAHVLDGVEGEWGANSWVDETLGDDYLAAPIGWLFFVDLPRSLLGFGYGAPNRSEMMERAWEASWPDGVPGLRRGLRDLWESGTPPLVFNGASVTDGCRVNISALDVDGGSPEVPSCSGIDDGAEPVGGSLGATHDLVDFLCPGDDVALATAAGMSSRYPVVATAGRMAADPSRDCAPRAQSAVYVVDGGYLEGSGAGTLLDAWEAIRDSVERHNGSGAGTCVVPFMMHIDNGYENPGVVGEQAGPRELAVPLMTVANSSSGIALARAEAALAFEHPFTIGGESVPLVLRSEQGEESVDSRYVRLVTRAHPGVQAPLGWTLSRASIDDLRDQLALPENVAGLEEVRRWLDGEMYCGGW